MHGKKPFYVRRVKAASIKDPGNTPIWRDTVEECYKLKVGEANEVHFNQGQEDLARRAGPSIAAHFSREGQRQNYRIMGPSQASPLLVSIECLARPFLKGRRQRE